MKLCRYRVPFANRWVSSTNIREVTISGVGVEVGATNYPFHDDGDWACRRFLFWKKISFHRAGMLVCAFLLRSAVAEDFMAKAAEGKLAERQRQEHVALLALAELHRGDVDAVLGLKARWNELTAAKRFIPRHEIAEFAGTAKPLIDRVPKNIWPLLHASPGLGWNQIVDAIADHYSRIERANAAFVTDELARWKETFDGMRNPPTLTQREIAVRDETNALVVAGAGTGKTSTILTKVAYLVHAKLASPEAIIVVAFNRDAAQEIRDRCREQGVNGVSVETFHALGLMILGQAHGAKPAVLSEVKTDRSRDELVAKLMDELCQDVQYAERYARFLLFYSRPNFSPNEAQSKEEHVRQTQAFLTRSLQGEWVRSTEELRIANWLFVHGVSYEYEALFPLKVSAPNRREYRPDFTITAMIRNSAGKEQKQSIYLEHQALDEEGRPPPWMEGYAEKVRWAKDVHCNARTTLVESFSWWFQRGIWEQQLEEALRGAGVEITPVDWPAVVQKAEAKSPDAMRWERTTTLGLLRRSLDLVRTMDSSEGTSDDALLDLRTRQHERSGESAWDAGRTQLFDELFVPLYRRYESYKRARSGIDFEDMIFAARQVVEQRRFNAPWSHYIVDEFQDSSRSRLRLILALRGQRSDSRLLCVGDDWQSIIRFAGSDIRVMTQFQRWVGPFWRADLDQTFRSSPNIAELSREFVLQNPDQLRKDLRPAKGRRDLPIRIVFRGRTEGSDEGGDSAEFRDVQVEELTRISDEFPRGASVLVLSRYRRGVPAADEQRRIRQRFPSLEINWSTAHSAKGLEADAVIVGDLDDGPFGFPCLREDDPLIRRLLPPEDAYPYAEERRLFYVAMTRAKERLVLVANQEQASPFVLELLQLRSDGRGLDVVRQSGVIMKNCPACHAGIIVARDGVNGRFFSCTKSPVCSYTEEACPKCRRGFLIEEGEVFVCSNRAGGCHHQAKACPRCRRGWLEIKANRQNGAQFLGCSCFRDEDAPCTFTENLTPRTHRFRGRSQRG